MTTNGTIEFYHEFIEAIHGRFKILVEFRALSDGKIRKRVCAPMDFGPGARDRSQTNKFHLWDYDSPDGPHTLSLEPSQLLKSEPTGEPFDPAEFVTWSPNWIVERDWGAYS